MAGARSNGGSATTALSGTVAVRGPLTSNNAEGLRDLVVAALGIGQLATFLISDELRDGRLVPILAAHASEGEPLSVVYPSVGSCRPRSRRSWNCLSRHGSRGRPGTSDQV